MQVLIVEPTPERAAKIQQHFVAAAAVCDVVDSGDDLERGGLDHDLVVISVSAKTEPETISRLRRAGVSTPIIALISCPDSRAPAMRLHFLEQGADDALAVPVSLRELVLRAKTIYRRRQANVAKTVRVGALCLDLDERTASVGGVRFHVTRCEFGVLETMALRANKTVTKQQFLTQMYQEADEPSPKIVDVWICKLRQKIAAAYPPAKDLIETVWGRGYIMRDRPEIGTLAQAA